MADNNKKMDASERDPNLKKLKLMENYFPDKILQKSRFGREQCAYIALTVGYSQLMGGLPGVDDSINAYAEALISLDGKGRQEFVDSHKAGNTVVTPSYAPVEHSGGKKGILERITGR